MDKKSKVSTRTLTFVITLSVGALILLIVMPLLLANNSVAQILFNVLMAFMTTTMGIYASRKYSQAQSQEELTRYGLQAWRNLDSLSIKLSEYIDNASHDTSNMRGWQLDIDQGKLAWRDLLREAFKLQERLELETEELAVRYKEKMVHAHTDAERSNVELEHNLEMLKLAAQAPLPLKKQPVSVTCPNCSTVFSALLGTAAADSAWPNCPNCQFHFPIHRLADGSFRVGGHHIENFRITGETEVIHTNCPGCKADVSYSVSVKDKIEFVQKCPSCKTHIQFSGNATDYSVTDLGINNAQFVCPFCQQSSQIWISPDRQVSFFYECENCRGSVQISGQLTSFGVQPLQKGLVD